MLLFFTKVRTLSFARDVKEKLKKDLRYLLLSTWENVSRISENLINVCKILPLALDYRQIKYSLQIVHHNPCFNLFILHNNSFDNQGNEINENDIFFKFRHTVFYKNCIQFWARLLRFLFCVIYGSSSFLLLFVLAQKVCLRFLKSYFRIEILIFLFFEVSF